MKKHIKQFSAEFKQDAVNYYQISRKTLAEAAATLKVGKIYVTQMS